MTDITVFTGERSAAGYRLNKLAASLVEAANREAFLSDEAAYCAGFGLTESEARLVAERDWSGMVAAGGNVYVFLKIAATIGSNLIEVGAAMRGESVESFLATRPVNQPADTGSEPAGR
jgi:protocatechuate 4,5-dioxygenase alpha subunit